MSFDIKNINFKKLPKKPSISLNCFYQLFNLKTRIANKYIIKLAVKIVNEINFDEIKN